MNTSKTPLHHKAVRIEEELNDIRELISFLENDSLVVSYEKRLMMEGKLNEYLSFEILKTNRVLLS